MRRQTNWHEAKHSPAMVSHATRNRITEQVRRLVGGKPCRLQVAALPWRKTETASKSCSSPAAIPAAGFCPRAGRKAASSCSTRRRARPAEEAGLGGAVSHFEIGSYFYGKVILLGHGTRAARCWFFRWKLTRWRPPGPRRKSAPANGFRLPRRPGWSGKPDLGEVIARFVEESPSNTPEPAGTYVPPCRRRHEIAATRS